MKKLRELRPPPLREGSRDVVHLVDTYFNAYNAGRLKEACQIYVGMIEAGATIGLSISGALTPAGLSSVLTPLMEAGFVDYITSTGANLYHDLHHDLGFLPRVGGTLAASGRMDLELRKEQVFRVYDVLLEGKALFDTDDWLYRVLTLPELRGRMGTARLHHEIGRHALAAAQQIKTKPSILATAHRLEIPVWTPSPGDSTIGLGVAAVQASRPHDPEVGPQVDPSVDVNQMAAVVHDCKVVNGGKSGVCMLGGGAPKNFLLQTEPQLQELLGFAERGHDFFVQITDARVDTGGLSGATPSEAVSWGKIDPERLPDCVTAYCDSTIALPLLASYLLERCKPRPQRRLYGKLSQMTERLAEEYRKSVKFRRLTGQ